MQREQSNLYNNFYRTVALFILTLSALHHTWHIKTPLSFSLTDVTFIGLKTEASQFRGGNVNKNNGLKM